MYNVYISMVPDNNLYQKLSIKIFFVTSCVACVASDPPRHAHSRNVHVGRFQQATYKLKSATFHIRSLNPHNPEAASEVQQVF